MDHKRSPSPTPPNDSCSYLSNDSLAAEREQSNAYNESTLSGNEEILSGNEEILSGNDEERDSSDIVGFNDLSLGTKKSNVELCIINDKLRPPTGK